MARSRNIKPSFFTNEELADLGIYAHFLFPGLWVLADCNGVLEYRPKRIKIEAMPYYEVNVVDLLDQLARAKFIEFFESGGCKYIRIIKFREHQNPHPKEKALVISAEPQPSNNLAVKINGQVTAEQQPSPEDSLLLNQDIRNPEPPIPQSAAGVVVQGSIRFERNMLPLPDVLSVPTFRAAWDRWLDYLNEKGNRYTQATATAQLAELARDGPSTAIWRIDETIKNGWLKLAEKEKPNGKKQSVSDDEFRKKCLGEP